jgi:hypothetical protein
MPPQLLNKQARTFIASSTSDIKEQRACLYWHRTNK